MQTTVTESTANRLEWKPVAGAQAVVFIATAEGRPQAIIELRPGHGYHVTMCNGESLGQFDSLAEGQVAVTERRDGHALAGIGSS